MSQVLDEGTGFSSSPVLDDEAHGRRNHDQLHEERKVSAARFVLHAGSSTQTLSPNNDVGAFLRVLGMRCHDG